VYQVLARKWRPHTFEELVGQPHVARTLGNAIEADRLAHAYVFAGLRGTGKTSAARILAKCLNCEQGPTRTPCNTCTPCVEITEGRAMDVLEMDAASRTGIDDIRELQEMIQYPPVRDRTKLLIIDEAHMLSKQAFNALLKTLEEPPPQVVFVLATTELHKVLPTILSRCQVFEFRRVGPEQVADHLERLAAAEDLEISRTSLARIARAGEGSVRDSLSLLERILAFCGKQADDDEVLRVLGTVQFETLEGSIGAIAKRDTATLIGLLDKVCAEGHDMIFFWNELVGALRDLLLVEAAPEVAAATATRSPQELEALQTAVGSLPREDILRILQILAALEPALKSSSRPRFLFEAALVRICELGRLVPIEQAIAEFETVGPTRSVQRPAPAQKKKTEPPVRAQPAEPPKRVSSDRIHEALLASIERSRPMIAAWLGKASSIRAEGSIVRIELPPGEKVALEHLTRESTLQTIAKQVRVLLSGDTEWSVEIDLRRSGEKPAEITKVKQQAAEPSLNRKSPSLGKEVQQDPDVARLLKTFGAQILDVEPLRDTMEPPLSTEEDS
jgi:DNA polymerase-3 subunit gamma/tau